MRHVYSVVRYVPNVANGERVNLGLLAGSEDTGEWSLMTIDHGSRSRARQLGGEALPEVFGYLEQLTADLERYTEAHAGAQQIFATLDEEITERWLSDLASRQRGVVQFSSPLPVDAASADAAISLLWDDLIVEKERRKSVFQKKNTALGAVRKVFREAGLDHNVWNRATLKAKEYSAPVDFAIYDGAVSFLTNCWSFQIPNKADLLDEIQSWAWVVRSLRDEGGHIVAKDKGPNEVARDILMSVVYVPPGTNEDNEALEVAQSAFRDVQVDTIVTVDDVNHIVDPAHGGYKSALLWRR